MEFIEFLEAAHGIDVPPHLVCLWCRMVGIGGWGE